MRIIEGNLLDIKKGIICHQVNTYGTMGGGLALDIKRKFPNVNKEYEDYCNKSKCLEKVLLGKVLYVNVYENDTSLIIANVFSQVSFNTDCELIEIAFKDMLKKSGDSDIYIPYKYGCGIAGGNWDDVVSTFLHLEKECQKEITVVKLPN